MNRQGVIAKDHEGNYTFGAMDRLIYHYEGNRLLAVDDGANTDGSGADFRDWGTSRYCAAQQEEYQYDVNGSLISDTNKGIQTISYNASNLPTEIITDEAKVVYVYDAAGIKLQKEVYQLDGTRKSKTDYVGSFVYTDDEIEFIHHSEGRLLPDTARGFKYEYHYKDHLGNLRLSFREESSERLATMEDSEEADEFDNWAKTRVWANNIPGFAHSGVAIAETDGANANRTMGPATAFAVAQGDVIKVTAYSRFERGGNTNTNNLPLPAIGANTNFGLEGVDFFNNGAGVAFSRIMPSNGSFSRPQAYAIIRLLDANGDEVYSESRLVENTAGSFQPLSLTLEVIQGDAKYAVVYVANESRMRVYFDDIHIEHERLIWQENNYYPFGLAIKPLDQEYAGAHKFTYNGKELEEETGFLEFESRHHDPQLGRFHTIDPKTEEYNFQSPYAYAANDPIRFIEVRGENPGDPKKVAKLFYNVSVMEDDVWPLEDDDDIAGVDAEFEVSYLPSEDKDGIGTIKLASNINLDESGGIKVTFNYAVEGKEIDADGNVTFDIVLTTTMYTGDVEYEDKEIESLTTNVEAETELGGKKKKPNVALEGNVEYARSSERVRKGVFSGSSSVRSSRFRFTANNSNGDITSALKQAKTDGKKYVNTFSGTPAEKKYGDDLYIEVRSKIKH